MAKTKKKYLLFPGIILFLFYLFVAAQPVPQETVLIPRWLTSFETGFPIIMEGSPAVNNLIIPFQLGNRYGYVQDNGQFILNNQKKDGYLSFSPDRWSEYGFMPVSIDVYDPENTHLVTINNPGGYPFFLDNRIFIISNEQNTISRLDDSGTLLWSYDFPAPLTCVDAAAGFLLAGTLDGSLELLNEAGNLVYSFEPGGSRLAVIAGCAISGDGSKLAVISGIDEQRFLVLEKSGDSFRVVYHEFLSKGFRRAVHVKFIDNDNRIVYEHEKGISIHDIASRTAVSLPLEGEVAAMGRGDSKYLFIIMSDSGGKKRLIGVKMPGIMVMNAPFNSESVFISRDDSKIYIGGDKSLISFDLGKK